MGGYETFIQFLAMSSAFASIILHASIIKPEDKETFELLSTTPYPIWKYVTVYIVFNLSIIISLSSLFSLITIANLNYDHLNIIIAGSINVLINVILFGSIAILGTAISTNSTMGQLIGLSVIVFSLLLRFPDVLTATYFFTVHSVIEETITWWSSRLIYMALSTTMLKIAIQRMQNTDQLLTQYSSTPKRLKQNKSSKPHKILALLKPLSNFALTIRSKFVNIVIYESFITLLKGMPAIILVVINIFIQVMVIIDSLKGGNLSYNLAVEVPRFLAFFTLPVLPFLLVNTIPSDKHAELDQHILTIVSPPFYLLVKTFGAVFAVWTIILTSIIPLTCFLILNALISSPILLITYMVIIFIGLLPALFYVGSLSVLLGALSLSRRPFFLSTILAVGIIAVFFLSSSNHIFTILFPTGMVVIETLSEIARQELGINIQFLQLAQTASWEILLLSLFSIAGQTVLIWIIASRLYMRRMIYR